MRILLTNDDGIDAPGLHALYWAIRDLGEVHVAAPAEVQSAMSHSVTFHRSIRVAQQACVIDEATREFLGSAVDGRPADCVKLGLEHLVPKPVDLVISGMNSGANVGINVIYSGTVAAAMEAAFMGVPAIAVSLHVGDWNKIRWAAAADYARQAIERILAGPMQRHTVMNVNVPILDDGATPRGMKVVPISTSPAVNDYDRQPGDDGEHHYTLRDSMRFHRRDPDTDLDALLDKYITLTPLHFDLTHYPQLEGWHKHLG